MKKSSKRNFIGYIAPCVVLSEAVPESGVLQASGSADAPQTIGFENITDDSDTFKW